MFLSARLSCRWWRFLSLWALIAVVWLKVLPAIASRPRVHARLEELSIQGIDPSAMFYSELPAMDGVFTHLDQFHRRYPGALWRVEGRPGDIIEVYGHDCTVESAEQGVTIRTPGTSRPPAVVSSTAP